MCILYAKADKFMEQLFFEILTQYDVHMCVVSLLLTLFHFCLSNQVCTAFCHQIYNLTQNIQEDDLQHLQVNLNSFQEK